jgi:hypothetical protein
MDINLKLNTEEFIKKEFEEQIKEQLAEIVNKYCFQNPDELNKNIIEAVREVMQFHIRRVCYEILRDKEGLFPPFSEFYGTVSFTTTVAGSYSIVPLDYQENLLYSTQCVNLTGQPAGQTNQCSFVFKSSNPGDIKYIGIKGANSNGTVNITHLAGIYKE